MIMRDLIASGAGNVISSFNGRYDSISISWLNDATIALALRRHPEPPEESQPTSSSRSPIRMRRTLEPPPNPPTDCN